MLGAKQHIPQFMASFCQIDYYASEASFVFNPFRGCHNNNDIE